MLSPDVGRPARSRNSEGGSGEFVDGIVEASMRSLIVQLKAEYQKELKRASVGSGDPLRAASRSREQAEPAADLVAARLPNLPDEVVNWPLPNVAVTEDSSMTAKSVNTLMAQEPGEAKSVNNLTPPKLGEDEDSCKRRSSGNASRTSSIMRVPGVVRDADEDPSGSQTAKQSKSPFEPRAFTDPGSMGLSKDEIAVLKKSRDNRQAMEVEGEKVIKGRMTDIHIGEEDDVPKAKRVARCIVASRYFDFFMGAIIILNAVTIGMETTLTVHGKAIPLSLHVLENTMLLCYTLEIALRFYAIGVRGSLKSHWVRFDLIIVVAGLWNFVLTVLAVGGETVNTVMKNAKMMKMLRLARLARTVRVLVQFRTLWLLVQGLMYAILPMFWTCIIMILVVYTFSIAGMEMIVNTNDDPEFLNSAKNFDTISASMMTLLQFMTLDSAAQIYRPLITQSPGLSLYFLIFFLIGPIALMNIVTAIMVESSLRTANDDVEAKKAWEAMKKKEMMPKLRNMFMTLDDDGNGLVDLEEIQQAPNEVKEQIRSVIDLEEIEEIFNMLDLDGSGTISIDEFVDGIMRSQADKPSELIVLMKQGRTIIDCLRKNIELSESFSAKLSAPSGGHRAAVDSFLRRTGSGFPVAKDIKSLA